MCAVRSFLEARSAAQRILRRNSPYPRCLWRAGDSTFLSLWSQRLGRVDEDVFERVLGCQQHTHASRVAHDGCADLE